MEAIDYAVSERGNVIMMLDNTKLGQYEVFEVIGGQRHEEQVFPYRNATKLEAAGFFPEIVYLVQAGLKASAHSYFKRKVFQSANRERLLKDTANKYDKLVKYNEGGEYAMSD